MGEPWRESLNVRKAMMIRSGPPARNRGFAVVKKPLEARTVGAIDRAYRQVGVVPDSSPEQETGQKRFFFHALGRQTRAQKSRGMFCGDA
jgi:hypothetical protein